MLSTLANLLFGEEGDDVSDGDDGQQRQKSTRTGSHQGNQPDQGQSARSPRSTKQAATNFSKDGGNSEDSSSRSNKVDNARKGSGGGDSKINGGNSRNGHSSSGAFTASNSNKNITVSKNGISTIDVMNDKGAKDDDKDKQASTNNVRKRGRPKGSYKVHKKLPHSVHHNSSYDTFSHSSSFYDFSDYDSFDKERRYSIRSKPIDPSKEIVVIVPSDDPVERLNLAPHEVEEFLSLVNDQTGIFLEASPSHSNSNLESLGHAIASSSCLSDAGKTEIFTPGVMPFKFGSSSKLDSPATGSGSAPIPVSFCDYEADSDDESFLAEECTYKRLFKQVVDSVPSKQRAAKIASSYDRSKPFNEFKAQSFVSAPFFEHVLECLERELETSRKNLPLRLEIEELVSAGQLALKASAKFMSLCDENDGNSRKFEQLQRTVNTLRESNVKGPIGVETLRQMCISELTTASIKNDVILTTNESLVSGAEASVAVSFLSPENKKNKRKWSTYYADAARKTTSKLDLILYPKYTVEQLRIVVPEERALQIFRSAKDASLLNNYAKVVPLVLPQMSSEEDLRTVEEMIILNIYEYWLEKRASRKVSLLRCYHNYIMENWQQQKVNSIPSFPEDVKKEDLLETMKKMLRLRHDLDRSRLIIDRIRRREKIKRDIQRLQSISCDQLVEGYTSRSSVNNNVFLARRTVMEGGEEEEEGEEQEEVFEEEEVKQVN